MVEAPRHPDPAAHRDGARAVVPVPAARRPRDLRLQPEPHPGLAAGRLHAPLVRRGGRQPGRASAPSSTRSSRRPRRPPSPWSSGTLAALAVQRYDFFGRQTISFLLVLPIALPGVVTGIALRTTFATFGVDFGLLTIIVGHATFCVVIVYNNVDRPAAAAAAVARGGLGRPRRRLVHDVPAGDAARHAARRCCRAACWPSPCRSTRSSSRTSRPAPARRRSRCGSSPRSSARTSCPSSTSSRWS